jgi:sugar-specific transcriptional regulator TrmB
MNAQVLVDNLGLTDKEAAVYVAILELGDSTIQPIATRSGVKRTSIYYFIDRLVELGLVEVAKMRGRLHYKALSPEQMVSLQERRLEEIKEVVPEFLSIFNVSTKKPKIAYYEGAEQMKAIMREESRCHSELLRIWSDTEMKELFGAKFLADIDRACQNQGIQVRAARPQTADFPMSISIYDTGKVGLMTSRKEGFGIMIESEEFVQTMRVLFEAFWAISEKA